MSAIALMMMQCPSLSPVEHHVQTEAVYEDKERQKERKEKVWQEEEETQEETNREGGTYKTDALLKVNQR